MKFQDVGFAVTVLVAIKSGELFAVFGDAPNFENMRIVTCSGTAPPLPTKTTNGMGFPGLKLLPLEGETSEIVGGFTDGAEMVNAAPGEGEVPAQLTT